MCGDGPASDVGVACLRGADCYRVGCGRSRRGGSLMTSHRSKSWAPRALALAAVVGAASTGHGCAAFNNFVAATQAAGGLTPPTVVYQGATLVQAPGTKVSILWPFTYCALLGIAFLYYWPTLLALVSRAAPPKANATMMGVALGSAARSVPNHLSCSASMRPS